MQVFLCEVGTEFLNVIQWNYDVSARGCNIEGGTEVTRHGLCVFRHRVPSDFWATLETNKSEHWKVYLKKL